MAIFVVEDSEFHFWVVVCDKVPELLPSSLMALAESRVWMLAQLPEVSPYLYWVTLRWESVMRTDFTVMV